MKTLLYIDDNQDALELYSEILGKDFKVTTCSEPKDGIEQAKSQNFDAVLLDIYFPSTTGFDLMLKLRTIPHYRNIPLFFISSENSLHNRLKALNMGSEDFIHRFMNPQEVLTRIKMRVNKNNSQQGPEPSVLKVGDIEVDQDNLIVRCNGEIAPLTHTEYKIIYILVKHYSLVPSSIIAKDDLIQFVWPTDAENVFSRPLSTHLSNLRKKLRSKQIKIATIRQNGLRLKFL